MRTDSQNLIASFDSLPPSEQREVIAELLCKIAVWDTPALLDDELVRLADESFVGLDGCEKATEHQPMNITIELTSQEIAQIKQITQLHGDSEAVIQAVREFLRVSRLRELKAASGKLDFEDRPASLEALELDTSH
jgi:Arc/MetJ family transcription regulator